MSSLINRRILLGISGGIAAYKSAELVRRLKELGADVRVVMTSAAQAFITPLTLQALSGNPVHTQLLDAAAEAGMGHIELARWAEMLLIAPASADLLARLANGLADDLLTTLSLATEAPFFIAPAMNQAMWRHPATQANVNVLATRGAQFLGPDSGGQACGDIGPGRMVEPQAIVDYLTGLNDPRLTQLAGKVVVVTAGPTREALDPVRYLTNQSSGKMGYALAAAAVAAGATTVLISGPTQLKPPAGARFIPVVSAVEMLQASLEAATGADIFIGAAAVADYRPAQMSTHKIKKTEADERHLQLVKNPDILAQVAALNSPPFMVGFAAETENLADNARSKLLRKRLDLIVANYVDNAGTGFNADDNAVLLLDAQSSTTLNLRPKTVLARDLLVEICARMAAK